MRDALRDGMQSGEETRHKRERGHPQRVRPVAEERHITYRINLLIELQPAVMIEQSGNCISRR